MRFLYFFLFFVLFLSCSKKAVDVNEKPSELNNDDCIEQAKLKGILGEVDGILKLRGGNKAEDDFIVTGWELKPCQLKYGLGREAFDALIEPRYASLDELKDEYKDTDRFIIVKGKNKILAYSIKLLITHEVINETIDGRPIMIAYCVLADLGAVYTRMYCGKEFTFALSGYTYSEKYVWDGLDGFLLWDRETESLWWPLIDKAVSGQMQDVFLEKAKGWRETTWRGVKKMTNVYVLKSGQTMTPPQNWPRYENVDCN